MPVQGPDCWFSRARPGVQSRLTCALALLAVATLSVGCAKHIGDACTLSTDCSINGDRLCDTTQPGGYCTQFNCEPNSCPDNSVCVRFAESTCSAPTQSARFVRTFCIGTCESDGDCRGDYRCVDLHTQPGRTVVDLDPPTWKVCIVPEPGSASDPAAEPAICRPPPSMSAGDDSGSQATDAASEAEAATIVDGSLVDGNGMVDAAVDAVADPAAD
jgi:hypothetical protein